MATIERTEVFLLDLWNEIQADVPGVKRVKRDGKPDTILSIARLTRAIVNDNPEASVDVRASRFGLIPVPMRRSIPERQLPFCRSGLFPLCLKITVLLAIPEDFSPVGEVCVQFNFDFQCDGTPGEVCDVDIFMH